MYVNRKELGEAVQSSQLRVYSSEERRESVRLHARRAGQKGLELSRFMIAGNVSTVKQYSVGILFERDARARVGQNKGRQEQHQSESEKSEPAPFINQTQRVRHPNSLHPRLCRPPSMTSMTASAVSRDTLSVQATGARFFHLKGTLFFPSLRPRLARESCGGIWFHQPSIRSRCYRP
jgi:hypothetical protein